ncbi:MAG: [Fe-Fe] hydrogenase large subunit C-terminal domain-containing protein [Calditrichia bacterium]
MEKKYLYINGKKQEYSDEKNLLEVIRNANVEIPTFCYHSELSVYGACRLCLVEVDGRGLQASCSLQPEPEMKVRTHTEEIRRMRQISLELLLANHSQNCYTCGKNTQCKLQDLASQLGVTRVRYKRSRREEPLDTSSRGLVRDPNKCILCGDCVRACEEIQGIGAIDFAHRGAKVVVVPAYEKELSNVECVDCGQCARVCPTGAIMPKSEIEEVWQELDSQRKVVAQIAPAVRVALGEMFGLPPGEVVTGKIVAALKMLGFDAVYDTAFAADLTVIEEAHEFLQRKSNGENLPLLTSCCPAWVRYAEQYFPEKLNHLSSCKSPQQMFGVLAKHLLPEQMGTTAENIRVVSIMPCTAKKWEARRPEMEQNGHRDVDYVLTTQELAQMIRQAGIRFEELQPESLDMPLGFKTGAGMLFGASGGVSEAVVRYLAGQDTVEMHEVEAAPAEGVKTYRVSLNGETVRVAVVQGLRAARQLMNKVENGDLQIDLIEVMACPGGCVGGAGQPISHDATVRCRRTRAILETDKMLQLHQSGQNPYLREIYQKVLEKPGSHLAHQLLHTRYQSRKRILESDLSLILGDDSQKMEIQVCLGTSCYLRGAQKLLKNLTDYVSENRLDGQVKVEATFCMEQCDRGPSVRIGDRKFERCSFEQIRKEIEENLLSETVKA